MTWHLIIYKKCSFPDRSSTTNSFQEADLLPGSLPPSSLYHPHASSLSNWPCTVLAISVPIYIVRQLPVNLIFVSAHHCGCILNGSTSAYLSNKKKPFRSSLANVARNSPFCHNICGAMTKAPLPWAHIQVY